MKRKPIVTLIVIIVLGLCVFGMDDSKLLSTLEAVLGKPLIN